MILSPEKVSVLENLLPLDAPGRVAVKRYNIDIRRRFIWKPPT